MTTAISTEIPTGGLKSLLDGLRILGPAKLAAMALVSIGMLCMLAVLMLRGSGDDDGARMALLYGDLDIRDSAQMADILEKAHIPHQLSGQDDQLMVPASQVASARLLLAKSNLPSGGSIGYEIFDRGDSLTSTQFQQEINQTRALEGELVRSITLIQGVRGARVHLVLPHRDLFAQSGQPAQASVLLTMRGAVRLDPEAVQAILNLVSSAVPGLKPQAIAIVDNRGDVLARNGSALGGASGATTTGDDMRQAMELRLAHEVEDMLDASLGPDKVRAEASVTLDSEQINETQETFNPDQQVLRSQQTSSDKSRNTEAQQNTSVQNNLPNADAGRVAAGSQDDRREETSNYEIGRTTRVISQSAPRVARISLAVLVDGEILPGPHGSIWKPRDPQDLARMRELVKSAIGFDAKRGDEVTVESMRFDQAVDASLPAVIPTLLGLGLANADVARLAQTLLISLVALILGLLIFRPMLKKLLIVGHQDVLNLNGQTASPAGPVQPPSGSTNQLMLVAPARTDRPVDADGDTFGRLEQRQLNTRTSSARRLAELVEQYPEESISLFRTWLTEGAP